MFALPQNKADGRPNNINVNHCDPIIELPTSPSSENNLPTSPSCINILGEIEDLEDILDEIEDEDSCKGDDYFKELSTLKLDKEQLKAGGDYFEPNDMENSNMVVAYEPNKASKFMPELKCVTRLRTKRMV